MELQYITKNMILPTLLCSKWHNSNKIMSNNIPISLAMSKTNEIKNTTYLKHIIKDSILIRKVQSNFFQPYCNHLRIRLNKNVC